MSRLRLATPEEVARFKKNRPVNKRFEINKLKRELANEDYKIIKCYEATLTNEPLPYNIVELKAERDNIRSQIRELEDYVNRK